MEASSAKRVSEDDLKRLRALPLETVAAAIGGKRDGLDRAQWQFPNRGTFIVRDDHFVDLANQAYGRGAIDFVLKLRGGRFSEAVGLLERIASGVTSEQLAAIEPSFRDLRPKSLKLPPRLDKHLPAVVQRLVSHRRVHSAVVNELVQRHRLYADIHGNLVLVMRNLEGGTVGAEVHSVNTLSTDQQSAPMRFAYGTLYERGAFFVTSRASDQDPARRGRVFLVSNGLEAMALATMKSADLVISIGDYANPGLMDWLGPRLQSSGAETYCALPATPGGCEGANILQDRFGFAHFRPDDRALEQPAATWSAVLQRLGAAADRKAGREVPARPPPTEEEQPLDEHSPSMG